MQEFPLVQLQEGRQFVFGAVPDDGRTRIGKACAFLWSSRCSVGFKLPFTTMGRAGVWKFDLDVIVVCWDFFYFPVPAL